MAEHIESKMEEIAEKISDKISETFHRKSSDSDDDKRSHGHKVHFKSKVYRLFGRDKPLHQVLGAGKLFLLLYTVPVSYEKYEDLVDAYAEKAILEINKQYMFPF